MIHTVNKDAIARIVHGMCQVVGQGDYHNGDVALAIPEFMGRMIVSLCDTPVSGFQMAEIMEQHLKRTIVAGYTAKGFSCGPMEL